MFDWCRHNQCRQCPGSVIRFVVDEKTNVPETVGVSTCGCECHAES